MPKRGIKLQSGKTGKGPPPSKIRVESCAVPGCKSVSKYLVFASYMVKIFYKMTGIDLVKVCPDCVSKAERYYTDTTPLGLPEKIQVLDLTDDSYETDESSGKRSPVRKRGKSLTVNVYLLVDEVIKSLGTRAPILRRSQINKIKANMSRLANSWKGVRYTTDLLRDMIQDAIARCSEHFNDKPEEAVDDKRVNTRPIPSLIPIIIGKTKRYSHQ